MMLPHENKSRMTKLVSFTLSLLLLGIVGLLVPWTASRQVFDNVSLTESLDLSLLVVAPTNGVSDGLIPLAEKGTIKTMETHPPTSHTRVKTASNGGISDLRLSLLELWDRVVKKQGNRTSPFPVNEKRVPSSQLYSWIESVQQMSIWQFNQANATSTMNSITDPQPQVYLATHGSIDRWKVLDRQMRHWNGPVSLAIYINKGQQEIDLTVQRVSALSQDFEFPIMIHVLMEAQATKYPHNPLRELALHAIPYGSYWCALDADFVPPRNMHPRLQALLMQNKTLVARKMKQKALMVLPAFTIESHGIEFPTDFPDTREQVIEQMANSTMAPFKPESFAQRPTAYYRWRRGEARMQKGNELFYHVGIGKKFYEPYVIGYRGDNSAVDTLPHYWTGFRGWGRNKISFNHELILAGYEYFVLWNFFVVHIGGPASTFKASHLRPNDLEWKLFFRPYLNDTYRPRTDAMKRLLL